MSSVLFPSGNSGKPKSQNVLIHFNKLEFKIYTYIGMKVKVLVTQSCPTLCDPMDCSLPGSSVHGIFQARVLEWVAIAFFACLWGEKKR